MLSKEVKWCVPLTLSELSFLLSISLTSPRQIEINVEPILEK